MRNRNQPALSARPSAGSPEADQLEMLNARMRGRRKSSQLIRRVMEAQIEAKANRTRRHQTAASSAWKR